MPVSIIIPTLNEVDYLDRTLRGIRQLQPHPLEVLIVDGGSTDGTVARAQAWATPSVVGGHPPQPPCPVTLLSTQTPSRSIQMNLGGGPGPGGHPVFLAWGYAAAG
jgi:GT2 family glycosyltransferase